MNIETLQIKRVTGNWNSGAKYMVDGKTVYGHKNYVPKEGEPVLVYCNAIYGGTPKYTYKDLEYLINILGNLTPTPDPSSDLFQHLDTDNNGILDTTDLAEIKNYLSSWLNEKGNNLALLCNSILVIGNDKNTLENLINNNINIFLPSNASLDTYLENNPNNIKNIGSTPSAGTSTMVARADHIHELTKKTIEDICNTDPDISIPQYRKITIGRGEANSIKDANEGDIYIKY